MALIKLENKVVVVTGGTRGIGLAIAARLLEEGARVAICGTRQTSVDEALALLSGEKHEKESHVFGMIADVSKHSQVKAFVTAVVEHFGRIDVLINNAGVGSFRPVAELTPEEWERMIGLNPLMPKRFMVGSNGSTTSLNRSLAISL